MIRVFTCSTSLTYNLSKTRFDLMAKPFRNAFFGMEKNISHIKDSFKMIEDVVKPISDEIEQPDHHIKYDIK